MATGRTALPRREDDQPGAAISRVGAPLDVAQPFELLDGLGHRLLAHVGQPRQLADLDALGGHEREHVGVRRADVTEAGLVERRFDGLRPVLVQQPEQQAELRVIGGVRASGRQAPV